MQLKTNSSKELVETFLIARGYEKNDVGCVADSVFQIANENHLSVETVMNYIVSIT